jgi:hypothetical protein
MIPASALPLKLARKKKREQSSYTAEPAARTPGQQAPTFISMVQSCHHTETTDISLQCIATGGSGRKTFERNEGRSNELASS